MAIRGLPCTHSRRFFVPLHLDSDCGEIEALEWAAAKAREEEEARKQAKRDAVAQAAKEAAEAAAKAAEEAAAKTAKEAAEAAAKAAEEEAAKLARERTTVEETVKKLFDERMAKSDEAGASKAAQAAAQPAQPAAPKGPSMSCNECIREIFKKNCDNKHLDPAPTQG